MRQRSVPQDRVGTQIHVAGPAESASLDLHLAEKLGVAANRLKHRTAQQRSDVTLNDRSVGEGQPQLVATERGRLLDSQHEKRLTQILR